MALVKWTLDLQHPNLSTGLEALTGGDTVAVQEFSFSLPLVNTVDTGSPRTRHADGDPHSLPSFSQLFAC